MKKETKKPMATKTNKYTAEKAAPVLKKSVTKSSKPLKNGK